jgi:hypothetical protein
MEDPKAESGPAGLQLPPNDPEYLQRCGFRSGHEQQREIANDEHCELEAYGTVTGNSQSSKTKFLRS